MKSLPRKPRAQLQLSATTIELRIQVERLEFARRDAIARRDMGEVDTIDQQITEASALWAASFAADHAESFKMIA